MLKTGNVGHAGSTAAVLDGCLMGIQGLLGRSLAELRLPQRVQNRGRFLVAGFIEELAAAATVEAEAKGIVLRVLPVEDGVVIDADRQVLAAVVRDLLQNAFKFTRPSTTVTLRVGASNERVLIEILDECDGLPEEKGRRLVPIVPRSAAGWREPGSWPRLQPMGRRSERRPDLCTQPARNRLRLYRGLAAGHDAGLVSTVERDAGRDRSTFLVVRPRNADCVNRLDGDA